MSNPSIQLGNFQLDLGNLPTGQINVKAPVYGAMGQGVPTVDDSAAVTAAVLAAIAQGGTEVLIPPGTYYVNLELPPTDKPVTLRGSGWATKLLPYDPKKPVIKLAGTSDANRVWFTTIKDLAIYGVGVAANLTGHGIQADFAHMLKIDRVLIEGMPGDGIRLTGTGYDNVIQDSTIWHNQGVGVKDASATKQITPLWISRCRIEGNTGGGVELRSPTGYVSDSTIETNQNWQVKVHEGGEAIFVGCHFERFPAQGNIPLAVVGVAGDAAFSNAAFIGCRFYGNKDGTATADLRGVYADKSDRVSVRDCHLGQLYTGVEATANARHTNVTNSTLYNNTNNTVPGGVSFLTHGDGSYMANKGGSMTFYGGIVQLDAASKLRGIPDGGGKKALDFDGTDLIGVKGIVANSDVQCYQLAITGQALQGAAGGIAGYVQIKVGANFYKMPIYNP